MARRIIPLTLLLGIFNTHSRRRSTSSGSIGATVTYVYHTDGTTIWRKGMRDSYFVWDVAITPLGFYSGGIEDTDWVCRFKIPKS